MSLLAIKTKKIEHIYERLETFNQVKRAGLVVRIAVATLYPTSEDKTLSDILPIVMSPYLNEEQYCLLYSDVQDLSKYLISLPEMSSHDNYDVVRITTDGCLLVTDSVPFKLRNFNNENNTSQAL